MNRDHRPRDYRDTYGSDQDYEGRRREDGSPWPRRQGAGQLTEDVYAGTRNDQGFGAFGRPSGELYERDDPSSAWGSRGGRWHEAMRGRSRQVHESARRQQPWGMRHTSFYDDELLDAPPDDDDTSGYAQGYAGYGQPPRRQWTGPGGYGPSSMPGAWPRAAGTAQYREQGEHRGKGPMGYRRSDERIRDDVCEALTLDPWLDATHIQVNVDGGVVTLQGTVADRHMKYRAEECADQASGVQDVENRIRIATAGTSGEGLVTESRTRPGSDPLLSR
ncbi:BON domain-containing protein [Dyella sp. EPa41]|uniref:BON domain-containing protein n=1 Tax=Dyella sp. EPa41 TaxID=1561194 RepID=UPI001916C6B1|nr:BON domain-containing protein [Dyella sp. EPa41]